MTVKVDPKKCIGCGGCVAVCPVAALKLEASKPVCDPDKCTNCQTCIKLCPAGALSLMVKE